MLRQMQGAQYITNSRSQRYTNDSVTDWPKRICALHMRCNVISFCGSTGRHFKLSDNMLLQLQRNYTQILVYR